jgi:hypothetical protein
MLPLDRVVKRFNMERLAVSSIAHGRQTHDVFLHYFLDQLGIAAKGTPLPERLLVGFPSESRAESPRSRT